MRRAIEGPPTSGPYSAAIVAEGRFLYVSGQGPIRDGAVVAGSIEEQTLLTLKNLANVLDAAGLGAADVVRCGVFLRDIGDFDAMNSVYERFFPAPRPTRTTVGAELSDGMLVEIDCIALMPDAEA
jgi:2-iminobutanoate/2-iminopropanoate deaminase